MQLIQGNCLIEMQRLIDEGVKVDLILTDPPYRTTSRGSAGNTGGMLQKQINKDGKVFKHNDIKIEQYAPMLYDLLKDGGHFYIMTNHVNLFDMLKVCQDVGFHFIKSLIWDKGNKITGTFYMSQFEYILFFRKGKGIKINNCGTADILSVPNKKTKNKDGENLHDTEKPIELMRILIENSTLQGETAFDPFMGVGSSGIASKTAKRKFIGIELDETYFNIAKERINRA